MTFLLEHWTDSEYDLYTDPSYISKYLGKEHAITVVNHGKDLGSFLNWPVADHVGVLGNYRSFIKSSWKWLPIYGVNYVLEEHVLVERKWEKDQKTIGAQLDNLTAYPDPMWLCILAEGTRLSQEKLEASQRVAKEKGLPPLKHLLLPRTTGFVATVNRCRGKVQAVYDFTNVVCKDSDKDATFIGLFKGRKIRYKMMLKRYSMDELPKTDKELANWLHERYQEKDKLTENVLSTGEFEPKKNSVSTEKMKESYKNFEYVKIPKRKSSFWPVVCSAVIILGSLLAYLVVIFTKGDYRKLGMIITGMMTASFVLEKSIELSLSSKASSYGK